MRNYLEQTDEEKVQTFLATFQKTNRGYNFYTDWVKVIESLEFEKELNELNSLIKKENQEELFKELLRMNPTICLTIPLLMGVSKNERISYEKGASLTVRSVDGTEDEYCFNEPNNIDCLSDDEINHYYKLFDLSGISNLFQHLLRSSVQDYSLGMLTGLDSHGRKNRGGKSFEVQCEPLFQKICDENDMTLHTQKRLKNLREEGFYIPKEIENRIVDFVITKGKKIFVSEVNFFNAGGSKPQAIVDSYVTRQQELTENQMGFAFISDGNCWKGNRKQLDKAIHLFPNFMNYNIASDGTLEEVLVEFFK